MRLDMYHDDLVKAVRRWGRSAIESKQVARRLRELMPKRLFQIKQKFQKPIAVADAWRSAFTDTEYLKFVDEYVKISGDTAESYVQYETHLMLLQARQTLRAFRR
jgi:hypothetical protein